MRAAISNDTEPQLYRSLGKERVFVVGNRRWVCENDGDDIESDEAPICAATQHVRASRANDASLLFRIDSAFRRSVCRASPGFYFHKDKRCSRASDDINLAAAIGQPEVARHNLEALAAQVSVRKILALTPQRLIRRQ